MVGGTAAPGASTMRAPTRPVAGSFVSGVFGIPVPVAMTVPFPPMWARRSIWTPPGAWREKRVRRAVPGGGGGREVVLVGGRGWGAGGGGGRADDREEVGLDRVAVTPAGIRTIEARDIVPKRTPGDLVRGLAVADEAGRRRRGRRVPFQERSDIGRRQDDPEVTGGGGDRAAPGRRGDHRAGRACRDTLSSRKRR